MEDKNIEDKNIEEKSINQKCIKETCDKGFYQWDDLLEVVKVLRSPKGCPWDREQTHESLMKCLADECIEVQEAVEKGDYLNLREELGDILLQVLMNAQIAEENQEFTLSDVIDQLAKKMIRRHPHVFGGGMTAKDASEGLSTWNAVKKQEKLERLQEYEKWVQEGKIEPQVMESYKGMLQEKGIK